MVDIGFDDFFLDRFEGIYVYLVVGGLILKGNKNKMILFLKESVLGLKKFVEEKRKWKFEGDGEKMKKVKVFFLNCEVDWEVDRRELEL